jgi:hypothetical protein
MLVQLDPLQDWCLQPQPQAEADAGPADQPPKLVSQGKILLLDLGRSDGETNRLIGSLVVAGNARI